MKTVVNGCMDGCFVFCLHGNRTQLTIRRFIKKAISSSSFQPLLISNINPVNKRRGGADRRGVNKEMEVKNGDG